MRRFPRFKILSLVLFMLGIPSTAYADGNGDVGTGLVMLLIVVMIMIIIFLIFREVICWYWKINEGLDLLREIRNRLSALPMDAASSATQPQASLATAPSTIQCPQCSRQYGGNMKGLHCEDCGARL